MSFVSERETGVASSHSFKHQGEEMNGQDGVVNIWGYLFWLNRENKGEKKYFQ